MCIRDRSKYDENYAQINKTVAGMEDGNVIQPLPPTPLFEDVYKRQVLLHYDLRGLLQIPHTAVIAQALPQCVQALGVAGGKVGHCGQLGHETFKVRPVSYTHLDVYKRQEFACDFERSFVSSRIHSPYKTFVQVEHYPEAVSYTHLDVYKRQMIPFLHQTAASFNKYFRRSASGSKRWTK